MGDDNIWIEQWESMGEQPWEGETRSRRLPRGEKIGASVFELPPGALGAPYHFHHGHEELLVVLRGRPLLRTPDGERQLDEGEAIHFVRGPEGAHKLSNPTDEPVRYIFVSNIASPDAVEYPDTKELSIMAFTNSQLGKPLWDMRKFDRDPDE